MRTQLIELLTAYLSGWKSLSDCVEWLASLSWDDPDIDRQFRTLAGQLELLATEVVEGLRPETEFIDKVSDLVFEQTKNLYRLVVANGYSMAGSTSNTIVENPTFVLEPDPLVRTSRS